MIESNAWKYTCTQTYPNCILTKEASKRCHKGMFSETAPILREFHHVSGSIRDGHDVIRVDDRPAPTLRRGDGFVHGDTAAMSASTWTERP